MYDCVLILLAGATYGNPGGWVVTFVRLERVHWSGLQIHGEAEKLAEGWVGWNGIASLQPSQESSYYYCDYV